MSLTISRWLLLAIAFFPPIVGTLRADDANAASGKGHAPSGYTLAWSDEFAGELLDHDQWFYRDGVDRKRTYLASENAMVEHGELNLLCQVGSFAVDSDRYSDKGVKEPLRYKASGVISHWRFREGYFEARCRILSAAHWHPSFWLQRATPKPNNSLAGFCGISEIDIMECEPQRSFLQSIRVHDTFTGGEHRKLPLKTYGVGGMTRCSDQHGDWFVWGMKLTHKTATFYENDKPVCTVEIPDDFVRDSRNIVLSCLTIGDPVESGIQKYDWVRYYEQESVRSDSRKECENAIQQTNMGREFRDVRNVKASNGYAQTAFKAEKGDFTTYRIYVTNTGKYQVTFGGSMNGKDQGVWQLSVDGNAMSNVIRANDSSPQSNWELGEVEVAKAGYHEFRFECVKAPAGTCETSFDFIDLKTTDGHE